MSESANRSYDEKLALYNRLVATMAEIERKGATMPYTSRRSSGERKSIH